MFLSSITTVVTFFVSTFSLWVFFGIPCFLFPLCVYFSNFPTKASDRPKILLAFVIGGGLGLSVNYEFHEKSEVSFFLVVFSFLALTAVSYALFLRPKKSSVFLLALIFHAFMAFFMGAIEDVSYVIMCSFAALGDCFLSYFFLILFEKREKRIVPVLCTVFLFGSLFFVHYFFKKSVGIIVPATDDSYEESTEWIEKKLAARGIDYKTYRFQSNFTKENAIDIVKNKHDVYVIYASRYLKILKEVTNTPIVFLMIHYPIEQGFIESLDRSGGNLVGVSNRVSFRFQFEPFLKIFPKIKKIAVPYHDISSQKTIEEIEKEKKELDIEVVKINSDDKFTVVSELKKNNVDAVYMPCDTFSQTNGNEDHVFAYLSEKKIPYFSCNPHSIDKSLCFIIANNVDLSFVAASMIASIVDGKDVKEMSTHVVKENELIMGCNANMIKNYKIETNEKKLIEFLKHYRSHLR